MDKIRGPDRMHPSRDRGDVVARTRRVILVVEEEDALRNLIRGAATAEGHDVLEAQG